VTRILFVPRIDDRSMSERSPVHWRILSEGHQVTGLPAPWDRFLYDSARAKWPRYLLYPIDKVIMALRGLRLGRRDGIELVFCETAHHALAGLWIARMLGVPCVWDSHGSVKLFVESMGRGFFFSRVATALEQFLGKRVDSLITVAGQDVDAYASLGIPRSKMHIIPTCIDVSRVRTRARSAGVPTRASVDPAPLPVLLFFGSFKYEPNQEALDYINSRLAPYLERGGIRCEIHIAGRDIPAGSHHPLVKILGFVPDIYECLGQADLSIVPIWRGQGSKGVVLTKVLDAMAVGTPLVLSDYAARGTPGLEPQVHAFVAPSKERFPETVADALRHSEVWGTISTNARRLVEERYSLRTQKDLLEKILRGTLPNPWS